MQVVTDENNISHQFPDDATPEEMNSAIGTPSPPSLSQDIENRLTQTAIRSAKGEDTLPETVLGVGGSVALPLVSKAGEILNSFMPNYTPSGGTTFGSNRGVANPQPITADSPFSTSNVVSQVATPIAQTFPRLTRDVGNALAIEGIGAVGGLAKDAVGDAIKPLVAPAALPADVANVVKDAEAQGITIPNAALLNADSFAANHTNIKGYGDYKDAINKKAADLIGANDGGGAHETVNEAALIDARKNNGAAINKVDNGIGNVLMTPKYDAINQEVAGAYPSDNAFWKKFATDAGSVTNPDGTIHASDIRDLTGYNSDLAKKARGSANDAPQAQRVIQIFKDAVDNAATPTQRADLFDVNNKYKLMTEFNDVGKTVGAGSQLDPTKIRNTLNSAYSNPNEVQYPARNLQDTLNTFHPVAGTESPYRGLTSGEKPTEGTGGLTATQEVGMGIAAGHPAGATLFATLQKSAPWMFNKAYSPFTNSQFYREALLRNATPPTPVVAPKLLTYQPQKPTSPDFRAGWVTPPAPIAPTEQAAADAARQRASSIGLTPDVRAAQEAPIVRNMTAQYGASDVGKHAIENRYKPIALENGERIPTGEYSPGQFHSVMNNLKNKDWNNLESEQKMEINKQTEAMWNGHKTSLNDMVNQAVEKAHDLAGATGNKTIGNVGEALKSAMSPQSKEFIKKLNAKKNQ